MSLVQADMLQKEKPRIVRGFSLSALLAESALKGLDKHCCRLQNLNQRGWNRCTVLCGRGMGMGRPGEPVDKVIGRPGTR